jgi:GNAT superfamily N-acetyltransferase
VRWNDIADHLRGTALRKVTNAMHDIRRCRSDERPAILRIINAAAEAYRGVIPADCWHEPYMPARDLHHEMLAGVEFSGYELDGELVGVMGMQGVRDVDLIRHAYVIGDHQRHGIGAALISYLREKSMRQMLVGTWSAATWAIRFYQRNGFELLSPDSCKALLTTYWRISKRQLETSVVLASPPLQPMTPRQQ